MDNSSKISSRKGELEIQKIHLESMFIDVNCDDDLNPVQLIVDLLEDEINFLSGPINAQDISMRKMYLQSFANQLEPIVVYQEDTKFDLQWIQTIVEEEICFLNGLNENER